MTTICKKRGAPRQSLANRIGRRRLRESGELYLIMLPVLVMIFIFFYMPMFGVVIAFQDYVPGDPFFAFDGSTKWVGLQHFKTFFSSIYFPRLLKNTLTLSLMNLAFGFWVPIAFALLLNEVTHLRYKKLVQTASYMPYFISTVVVAGMVISFIDQGGLISNFLSAVFGLPNQNWRDQAPAFPAIYTITNVWKGFGFGSILYISSITSIDQSQYESARIDGANRGQQCWYITLPGIKNIIAINLILAIGGILGTNSDLILLLYSPATYDVADVIGTYTYRIGIEGGQYSYTAAAGLFMSVIGFVLTYIANKVSDKLTGFGLW